MRMCIGLLVALALITACGASPTLIPPGASPANQQTSVPPAGTAPLATTTPTPAAALASADEATRLVQQKFPELKDIQKMPPGSIGASTDIIVQDRPDGWNIIFWKGSGDCPAGCINNHYWYVAVDKSGTVTLAGEFVREFDGAANAMKARGTPMWGVPRQ